MVEDQVLDFYISSFHIKKRRKSQERDGMHIYSYQYNCVYGLRTEGRLTGEK